MHRPLPVIVLTLVLVPTPMSASCTRSASSEKAPQKPAAKSPTPGAAPKLDVGSILPISSTKPLTEEHVANLRPSLLKLARAEIAARHGHPFPDASLRAYFASQPWYRPLSPPTAYSPLERRNLALIEACEKSWQSAADADAEDKTKDKTARAKPCSRLTTQVIVDLDGDGKLDHVTFSRTKTTISDLVVNGQKTSVCEGPHGFCGDPAPHVTVIDFDVRDHQKEVLLWHFQGGMTASVTIYVMREGRLKRILTGNGQNVVTDGFGKVTFVDVVTNVVHFWGREQDFRFTAKGTLTAIPRAFYWMEKKGYETTMQTDLPLTVSPTDPKVAFTARKGEKVVLEGCDLKRHCRLANRAKQRGWFEVSEDNVLPAVKLKSSQVFDPLEGV